MSKSKYGKKVVKAVVKHRTCGTCKWWRRNRPGQKVRAHRCVKNHVGSARSMESASGEEGILEMAKGGTPVEYIEGDGDNTLVARLKTNQNIHVKKRFDRNHVVKNIGKHLYGLQTQNVKLSKNVISHIQKCLKYAFAKNQGDPTGMAENLKAIVPHQFGDHTLCQGRFCGYVRSGGEKYEHRSLPYKAPLKDTTGKVREALERVFKPVIANATSYCDLGSSQQCEHANREVTLRAPKSLHYGDSEALDFRVQATAAFINEGRDYITQTNEEMGLSPGVYTEKYVQKSQQQRIRHQEKSCLPSAKRRRLILKQERSIVQGAQEVLEGASYQSEIGHQSDVDVEQLPDAVPRGDFKPVKLDDTQPTIIALDLETTDLIRGSHFPHITQISAQIVDTNKVFNKYVLPKEPISPGAQQTTGITMVGDEMLVSGLPVTTVDIRSALESFITWLEGSKNVILTAHNGKRFDFPVLVSALISVDMLDRLFSSVTAFCDSLLFFRKVFPGLTSYKQETLAFQLLNFTYNAHDAAADVCALTYLFKHALSTVPLKDLFPHLFAPKAVYYHLLNTKEKSKHLSSLNVLLSSGIIKMATAENIAGSGLNIQHLEKIYSRDGEDGLRNIFVMKNIEGQPRVTNTKRTLESVIPKLAEHFNKSNLS